VRDESGRPVPGFSIITSMPKGRLERGPDRATTVFDAQGRYDLLALPEGHYAVVAVAEGYAPAAERELDLAEGGEATCDFTLKRGGTLSGRVLDGQSRDPIARAHVALEGAIGGDDGPVPLVASATSDDEGRFQLGGIEAGVRSILVTAERHHGRILSGLRIDEQGNLGPLTIELTPTEPGEKPSIELIGIGAVLRGSGDHLVIDKVIAGGGAAEAGLGPGDEVLAVDGELVTTLGFAPAIGAIRGPENSTVRLTIRRGEGPPADRLVLRRRIRG
jgi:hypothetical protein